ncbi:MAG: MTAP family purine nucleoside phosphorylase [Armatimonadota bacterium]|nr:MTAP family purine nucleoside phosphorylase [Armatimonadota bacterium]
MATAIIGGTGIGDLLQEGGEPVEAATQFGVLRAVRRRDGLLVVARHGIGHKVPPHKVPYKTMAAGLIAFGVDTCLSSAAVGSLDPDIGPGELVAVSDFIDFTGRNITMFEQGVHHTDFSPGVSTRLVEQMKAAGVEHTGIYACTNGPRYETPAEVRALRILGADLVGMTVASEATVMHEMGIEYGCLAIVTNFAAGIATIELSHEDVVSEVSKASARAVEVLLATCR